MTAVARIAREQPKTLAQWLAHVAEVEGAKQRVAEHPTPRRLRRTTHATTCTWPPSRHGKPSPTVGPPRCGPVDPVSGIARCIRHRRRHLPQGEQLIGDWCELAPECGIAVTDEDDELRPGIGQAITRTVTASVWFGVTTGCLTPTGGWGIPSRLTLYL